MEKGQVFGQSCTELLAKYDQNTHSLKMFQLSLFEEEPESLEILPKSGMTVNGKLWEQTMWAHPTGGNESGLWRTPDTCAGGTISQEMSDYVAENKLKRPSGQHHSLRLQDQVKNPKLWPTPRASEIDEKVETYLSRMEHREKVGKQAFNPNLSVMVKMWPTPCASEGRQGFQDRSRGKKGSQESLTTVVVKGNAEEPNNDSNRLSGWQGKDNWTVEPSVGRVAHGIPNRVDRLKGLGNAIVPQVAYEIMKLLK